MSIVYCTVPHFAAALARRDEPALRDKPLVLIGAERRVFDASAEAHTCGILAGMTARVAEIRCPGAILIDADGPACREAFEMLLDVLELAGPAVEAHGLGAAYVDASDLARDRDEGIDLCKTMGPGHPARIRCDAGAGVGLEQRQVHRAGRRAPHASRPPACG